MSDTLKLYASVGPNPRVVTMFAAEKGISFDREEIDIVAGECRREPYLSINPMGSTPALVLPSGQVVTEILAICEYLEETGGGPALIGDTPEARAEVRMWARRIDLEFVLPLTLGFRAAEGRPMFEPRVRVVRTEAAPDLKAIAFDMLDRLEQRLAKQPFVVDAGFSLADILPFCFIAFSELFGMGAMEGRPALAAWYAQIEKRPSASA